MITFRFPHTLLLAGIFFLLLAACSDSLVNQLVLPEDQPEPYSFFLSWQQDPATTMTVDWHTDPEVPSIIQFRKPDQNNWITVGGTTSEFPRSDRIIHRVELTALTPDQVYEFRFTGNSEAYRFRTMPMHPSRPILFATGGDMLRQRMIGVNRRAVEHDIDFVALGGDLAYSVNNADRWMEYLEAWTVSMIREDNRVIPHLSAVGNHEVRRSMVYNYDEYEQTDLFRAREAPFYYTLFAFPGQPGFKVLDFGNYLSLIFLDTDHTNPVDGVQTYWLKNMLSDRQDGRHIFPIYHVPAYPSARSPYGYTSSRVRESWVPLFEQFGVRASFENHDHTYKRTYPLRNGQIDPSGVVYVGDGAWGVPLRETHQEWYLEKAGSIRHFILVELNGEEINMQMINHRGDIFDELNLSATEIVRAN